MNAFAVDLKNNPTPTTQDTTDEDADFQFVSLEEEFVPNPKSNFEKAFTDMYIWVCKQLDAGQLNWQVLETAIWIEGPCGIRLDFPTARDGAIKRSLLVNGKLAS